LILFIGLAVGAYSSLFLATPIVVELKEREPEYKTLTKRVLAKRAAAAKSGEPVLAGTASVSGPAPRTTGKPSPAPRPGARPANRGRKRP
jgi:preprotein translocase subunit SecF